MQKKSSMSKHTRTHTCTHLPLFYPFWQASYNFTPLALQARIYDVFLQSYMCMLNKFCDIWEAVLLPPSLHVSAMSCSHLAQLTVRGETGATYASALLHLLHVSFCTEIFVYLSVKLGAVAPVFTPLS